MCLSSVYELKGDNKNLISEYISSVSAEGGKIKMTDIVGNVSEVEGYICGVDLVKSTIFIQSSLT